MNPQKANHLGVRYEDVQTTTKPAKVSMIWGKWWNWVSDDSRPGGRYVLTEGSVFECCRWWGDLRRMQL